MEGIDEIRVLKKLVEFIVDPIVHTINLSIGTVICLDSLKYVELKPIFKDGDKSLPNNYRPISLIPYVGEIF